MKYYSKSQYGKQLFKQTWNNPEPRASPIQVPLHPPDAPRVYSEMFCLHSDEDLSGGSWPLGISFRAQILKQDLFPQDTRETMNAQIYTHTHTKINKIKFCLLTQVATMGKPEKQVLNVFFCEKNQGSIINFLLEGRSIHKSRRNTSHWWQRLQLFSGWGCAVEGSSRLAPPSGHSVF